MLRLTTIPPVMFCCSPGFITYRISSRGSPRFTGVVIQCFSKVSFQECSKYIHKATHSSHITSQNAIKSITIPEKDNNNYYYHNRHCDRCVYILLIIETLHKERSQTPCSSVAPFGLQYVRQHNKLQILYNFKESLCLKSFRGPELTINTATYIMYYIAMLILITSEACTSKLNTN